MPDRCPLGEAGMSVYPVTLDPDKPTIALGMPKEVFAMMLQNTAEMVCAVLNCGVVEDRTDPETGKEYVFFRRNLEDNEGAEEYLNKALTIANMFFEKVATLMAEQDVADNPQRDNYWRLLIDLKREWLEALDDIDGAADRSDGERIGAARIQWNDDKGVIRVKIETLASLREETNVAISRILRHLGGVLDTVAQ